MRVLVMGMNYVPEKTGIGPFTAEMCEHWVQLGHQVKVVTIFPHFPEWKTHSDYKGKLYQSEVTNGVELKRCYVYVPSKRTTIRRIVYDTSLPLATFLPALFAGRFDAVVCISPPIQLGVTAHLLSRIDRAPLILVIQDLLPDAAIALNMLTNPAIIHLANRLESYVYNCAQAILVVCQGFAENLKAKGVPGHKLHVASNWVDTEFIRPLPRLNAFREEKGISEDGFLVLYAGNMSTKQGLNTVLEAAEFLGDASNIRFLLVGEGTEKAELVTQAEKRHLENVTFLPLQPRAKLPQMLASADVLLLSQRANVVDIVIPSKLLTYMAAGRPILAVVHAESEAGKYVTAANCGQVVPPERAELLAQAIRDLSQNESQRVEFGRNARSFAEENFEREKILARFTTILESVAGTSL